MKMWYRLQNGGQITDFFSNVISILTWNLKHLEEMYGMIFKMGSTKTGFFAGACAIMPKSC